jgi:putative aldouronate transport system permease protein
VRRTGTDVLVDGAQLAEPAPSHENKEQDRPESKAVRTEGRFARARRAFWRDRLLLLMLAPVIGYYILFQYVPMYGALVAFKHFEPGKGLLSGPWAGLDNFREFFGSYYFTRIVKNTVLLSVYSIIWGFPIPIVFAILLNELRGRRFRRVAQTATILPHFLSVAVTVGMITLFLSPTGGLVNIVLQKFGYQSVDFLSQPDFFRTIYVSSSVWQEFGWGAIIYTAALAGIDPNLYESAAIDGATRWQRIRYVTLPSIAPVAIIVFILDVGNLMSVGFEKVLLLYNPATYETGDIISTYTYRAGILNAQYGLAAAIGLFNAVINLALLFTVNRLARRFSETSLW